MENENTQVEKFDPSKLMDGVKDRIKATFVSLIPDEQWKTLCEAEMKRFFEPTYGGYRNEERKPSEFEKITEEIMKKKCRDYLMELFNNPKYSAESMWAGRTNPSTGNPTSSISLSEHLDNIIKEKMPDMLSAMVQNAMSQAFHSFFTNIKNNNGFVN